MTDYLDVNVLESCMHYKCNQDFNKNERICVCLKSSHTHTYFHTHAHCGALIDEFIIKETVITNIYNFNTII